MTSNDGKLRELLSVLLAETPYLIVLSSPKRAEVPARKIRLNSTKSGDFFTIRSEKTRIPMAGRIKRQDILERCVEWLDKDYKQLNSWGDGGHHLIQVSKKGFVSHRLFREDTESWPSQTMSVDREKRRILEPEKVPALRDLGVVTPNGKVVASKQSKFRQINRYVEIIDDEVRHLNKSELKIIDFGSGKSYLTFVLYYYLTEVAKKRVTLIGLDLKDDVVARCNELAHKYGYEGLRFEVGDIADFKGVSNVDIVVSLHACDTATDLALANAVEWGAEVIFAVPCCQHEVNHQLTNSSYGSITEYGLIKERFGALVTDAIRADVLRARGYDCQVLEYIGIDLTPKNVMIRASKRTSHNGRSAKLAQDRIRALVNTLSIQPTIVSMMIPDLKNSI